MKHNKSKMTVIVALVSIATILTLVIMNISTTTAQVQQAKVDIGSDEFRAAAEAKEKIALQLALLHPEVSKFTAEAFSVNHEFYPTPLSEDNTDKLQIHVTGKRSVIGDWQTSYTITYSNNAEISVTLVGDQITAVNAVAKPTITETLTFTKDEQFVIGLALQDPQVQGLMDGKNTFVRGLYDGISMGTECPPSSCYSVFVDQPNNKETVVALVNPATQKVMAVSHTKGW